MNDERVSTGRSQRIAYNALALFVRMFVIMLVNLYAVRLVLKGLGDLDYGIFNSIASVVTISACISSTLSVAIQRFYSMAIGHQNPDEFKRVFSISVNVVIGLLLVMLVLFETLGLWFVSHQMDIPDARFGAAQTIYQLALLTLSLSMLQIPFMAAIFANEDMGIYALISMVECLLRFGAAYLLVYASSDHLVFYSSGMAVAAIVVFFMYAIVAYSRYHQCRYCLVRDKGMYIQLMSFSGWTLYGSLSNIGLIQGSIILLNIFFGNIIVASFAIAQQINAAFNALSNSMVLAFRPAMIKAYAESNANYLNRLFVACNKFVIYIMAAVAVPIFFEMDTILRLWLHRDSTTTTLFARLIIIYIVCAALHHPITIVMQAIGRIKEYHLSVESICLLSVPLTWLLFHFGCPDYVVFVSMISLCLLAHVVRVVCISLYYEPFSISQYLLRIILPALLIILLCVAAVYGLHTYLPHAMSRLLFIGILSPCLILSMMFFVSFSSDERRLLLKMIPLKKAKKV